MHAPCVCLLHPPGAGLIYVYMQPLQTLHGACSAAARPVWRMAGQPVGARGRACAQITALGHSAGAHLWFMALLGRARAARRRGGADARMPARFVGMAGVYDIGQHYRYEAARGAPPAAHPREVQGMCWREGTGEEVARTGCV